MLTIAVICIASCERSFSKLKLVLSCLRASMSQGRFCDLALMRIERDETAKANFDEIVDDFASESVLLSAFLSNSTRKG